MHVTALIATFQRPAYLEAGVRALWTQTRPPDSIVIVTRDDDVATHAVVERLRRGPVALVHATVSQPGHLPPLIEGRRRLPAAATIVVQIDDDLMPHPTALAHVVEAFTDPAVGLVAGRLVEHDEGRPRPSAPRSRGGGEVSFSGRIRAAHSNRPASPRPHATQWATGAFAAYRRAAFDRIAVRSRLNVNVAIGYEIDWGLQICAMGYRAIFDPRVVGDHHNAPRGHGTARSDLSSRDAVFARNHNHTYVMLHHLRGARRVAYLLRHFAIGDRHDWGLGAAAYATVVEHSLRWRAALPHAYRGRVAAVCAYLAERLAAE